MLERVVSFFFAPWTFVLWKLAFAASYIAPRGMHPQAVSGMCAAHSLGSDVYDDDDVSQPNHEL